MKLADLVDHAAHQLQAAQLSYGHGTTNAFDEAAWLVLWRLGLPLDTPLEEHLKPITPGELQAVDKLLQQRITQRKPAAYLTREAWLQGVSFYVDERCIVPRSLIAEVLSDGSLDPWITTDPPRILDLCTGNGSLAVLAALIYPEAQVDAADISSAALEVAAINVQRHDVAARVHLHQSDGLARLPGCYDLILCNPPYVNALSMAGLPPEYRAEPALALDGNISGGQDGMDFIRQLLQDVASRLNTDGVLVLEVGNEREHFEAAFKSLQPIWLETSAGEDQVLLLSRDQLVL